MRSEAALGRLRAAGHEGDLPVTLVVAAHPDDETIGAGGRITKLAAACWVIHVTDGAPADRRFFPAAAERLTRAAYARARRDEAVRSLALAGVDARRIACFGLRDQEAAFDIVPAVERLVATLAEVQPEIVVTHAYEGGHQDHDTAAFMVHAGAALVLARGVQPPAIVEMTSYHDQGGRTVRGEFLPSPSREPPSRELVLELNEPERKCKRAMLAAYATQREVLQPFRAEIERFRLAPAYDFGAPPHDGRLHYERFGFGIAGAMWRAFARAGAKKLALPEGKL
jgi:LmbE family N-acetylglucosaminyl deacetylase